jgi:inosose dehydratase
VSPEDKASERIAAAPISWGVCEVPGWGYQLESQRVLAEMVELGIRATEFGPEGFLPTDPKERAAALAEHGLDAVGGFVPAVLHDKDHDPLPAIRTELKAFTVAGAGVLVLAAATGLHGYDERPALDAGGWRTLLDNLARAADAASAVGVTAVLHPHVGTMVENAAEVDRVLDGSTIGLCLDTGHLMVGGADPVAIATRVPERIAHVHLKDVDAAAARDVHEGRAGYTAAVAAGMYRPLGGGDVDVPAIVRALEDSGYRGWYVMEQDAVLDRDPAPGTGPVQDVRASMAYLRELVGAAR